MVYEDTDNPCVNELKKNMKTELHLNHLLY